MNTLEHLFSILGEECAEVSKLTSKINRFGLEDVNPVESRALSNQSELVRELNDLMAVIEMLVSAGAIPDNWLSQEAIYQKKAKVEKWLKYSAQRGTLKQPLSDVQKLLQNRG